MPRRMEVELTSRREDGTWTWRAAGARQPKGVLDGNLLYPGAKTGDVVRAEAELDIDGISVTSVLPPKAERAEPARLEIVGPPRDPAPPPPAPPAQRERPRPDHHRSGRDDHPSRQPRSQRPPRAPPTAAGRAAGGNPRPPPPPPPRPAAKRLRPGRAHRDDVMGELTPERQAVAEQLFRGGLPAVRGALERQNRQAAEQGRPRVPAEAVLSIAEDLLPQVRVADWLDRAEAAWADADELALRDLRSVVAAADDAARDESARELAERLREALDRRARAERDEWLADVRRSLGDGRVVRALRLASRAPQPGEGLPPDLTTRLVEAAGAAMTAGITADRWGVLLDAVAYAPVRQAVVPAGVPAEPGDELLALVRRHAGRVPAVARLFGTAVQASTPRPVRPPRRRGGPAASAPSGARHPAPARATPSPASPARRIPPPPPRRRPAPTDATTPTPAPGQATPSGGC